MRYNSVNDVLDPGIEFRKMTGKWLTAPVIIKEKKKNKKFPGIGTIYRFFISLDDYNLAIDEKIAKEKKRMPKKFM